MNERARAYLLQHAVLLDFDGVPELSLPLDKIQGFLDLIQPGDVPPEKLQMLYAMQAELVKTILAQFDQRDPGGAASSTDDRGDVPR